MSIQTRVEMTLIMERDFQSVIQDLKCWNFALGKDGFLTYQNPFLNPGEVNPMIFKFKPMTDEPVRHGQSTVYTVVFEGQIDNVNALLNSAFGTYEKVHIGTLFFNYFAEDYSVEKYTKIILEDTRWEQASYNAGVFQLPRLDFACLLHHDKAQFMTRSAKTFKDAERCIRDFQHYADTFNPVAVYNLFTFDELTD